MTETPSGSHEPDPMDGQLVHDALAGTVATLTSLTDGTGPADVARLPEVIAAVTDLDPSRRTDAEVLVAASIAVTSQVHDLLFHTGLIDSSLDTWDGDLEQLVACGLEGVHHVLVHHAADVDAIVSPSVDKTLAQLGKVLGPVVMQLARLPEDERRPLLQLVGARADLTARLTFLDRTLDELLQSNGNAPPPPTRPDLSAADGATTLLDWLHEHQAHQEDPAPEDLPSTLEVAAVAASAAAITTAVIEYFELAADEVFDAVVPFASTSLLLRTLWSVGGAWTDAFAHELAAEAPYAVAEDAIETVCTLTRLLAESSDDDEELAQELAEELMVCFRILAVVDHRDLVDDLDAIVDGVLRDRHVVRTAVRGDPGALAPAVAQAVGRARAAGPPRTGGGVGKLAVTTTSTSVTVHDRTGGAVTLDDPDDVALVIRQLSAWVDRT